MGRSIGTLNSAGHCQLRAIRPRDFDVSLVPIGRDAELPWITADLAVLHERPSDLWLEIDVDLLATVGARDLELRVHDAQFYIPLQIGVALLESNPVRADCLGAAPGRVYSHLTFLSPAACCRGARPSPLPALIKAVAVVV